jgi:hypothetical protein
MKSSLSIVFLCVGSVSTMEVTFRTPFSSSLCNEDTHVTRQEALRFELLRNICEGYEDNCICRDSGKVQLNIEPHAFSILRLLLCKDIVPNSSACAGDEMLKVVRAADYLGLSDESAIKRLVRNFISKGSEISGQELLKHFGILKHFFSNKSAHYELDNSLNELFGPRCVRKIHTPGSLLPTCDSPDGRRFVTVDERALQIWDIQNYEVIKELRDASHTIRVSRWSPDMKYIAAGTCDGSVYVWNADMYSLVAILKKGERDIRSLCWSSSGDVLVAGAEDGIYLWDMCSKSHLRSLEGTKEAFSACSVSCDKKLLALGLWDGNVWIYEQECKSPVRILDGHTQMITTLCWLPDNDRLASGSHDKSVRVWSIRDDRCVALLADHPSRIHGLSWVDAESSLLVDLVSMRYVWHVPTLTLDEKIFALCARSKVEQSVQSNKFFKQRMRDISAALKVTNICPNYGRLYSSRDSFDEVV